MADVDVFGLAKLPVPDFGVGTGNITIIVAIFFFAITIGIVIFLIWDWRTFNRRIVVFENISGQGFQPVLKDRARLIKLGDGGEEILYLKKKKVYRTAYGKKMGKNTYWFAIGQDGYWYNVVLGDIDAKMGMLDIEPIDRDMRYMHVAIRKNISDRYRKQSVMEKYGVVLVSGFVLIVMLIGLWFYLDKLSEMTGAIVGAVETAKELQESSRQLVSAINNLYQTSGIQEIPT